MYGEWWAKIEARRNCEHEWAVVKGVDFDLQGMGIRRFMRWHVHGVIRIDFGPNLHWQTANAGS